MRELVRRLLPDTLRVVLRGCVDTVRARARWVQIRLPLRASESLKPRPGDALRLGLLATRFPPEVGGGTYRPASLARYAGKGGLNVTVIAGPTRQRVTAAGEYLAGHVPKQVTVHRADRSGLRPFDRLLPALQGGFLDLLELYTAGDRALQDRRPDVILATGPPFNTFVAAERLSDRYGCPLILDYRDEWTECPFDFVETGPLDRPWEKRCLASAERVIFTTESQRIHALDRFPRLEADRCVVLPNGWEPNDWAGLEAYGATTAQTSPAVISFVGNLGDHTPPDEFLDELEVVLERRPELREGIRFRFVGQESPSSAERLAAFSFPEMIESVEQVPKAEASRMMRESAALLLLNGRRLHRYIPGKLYEYLAAGPPVIVHGSGGEVGALVERLEAGCVLASGDHEALTEALVRTRDGSWPTFPDRSAWLAEHTREAIAQRTVELVRAVAEGG